MKGSVGGGDRTKKPHKTTHFALYTEEEQVQCLQADFAIWFTPLPYLQQQK